LFDWHLGTCSVTISWIVAALKASERNILTIDVTLRCM
jgi:hypothetical protein